MLSITDLRRLYLGVQGENETRTIVIDVRPWLVQYPNGSVTIWHKRHGYSVPEPTGAVFDAQKGTVTWEPTDTDTFVAGEGEAEVRLMTTGGVIKKTRKVITGVSDAVTQSGQTLGSDWQSYINAVDALRAGAVEAKTGAETAQGLAEDARDDAEDAAELAEMWATGETEGTPGNKNNAKYWSEKSEAYKNEAISYAEAAEGSAGDAAGSASAAAGSAGDAAAWATGSTTPASSHSATNNAYYYSESAAASAQQANISKNSAVEAAGDAQEDALKAEGYAVGTQNGQQAGAPYFHDNAKYYAEQTALFAAAAGQAKSAAQMWATGGSSSEEPSATKNAKYYAEQAEAQVPLVEAAGAAQVALVEAEGETQIGLVEDKGEEVLESIPLDYSTLSSDVSDLKSNIEILEPSATSSDVGKMLKVKTVSDGKVTAYEFGKGGGSGGTSDYTDLDNKPQIAGVTLTGNKSLSAFGIASEDDIEEINVADLLLRSDLPGTTVTVTFDQDGNPATITHTANNTTIRTDVFTWGENTVTEVRTASDKFITITTNLETLAQTISDIEEVA